MRAVWAQRQEELLSDCIVSPRVFDHMVDRLRDFAAPYQQCLKTEAAQRNVQLYLAGLLSHVDRKNAEEIAALVDVERLVIQAFIGTAPWDHRPLVTVLVGQVVERLGEPDGIIAFDPSSFPKRGTHSVGVKRQWCGHRGKVDNCQVGVFMGYVSSHDHALLDFRLSLPEDWARDEQRRRKCHVVLCHDSLPRLSQRFAALLGLRGPSDGMLLTPSNIRAEESFPACLRRQMSPVWREGVARNLCRVSQICHRPLPRKLRRPQKVLGGKKRFLLLLAASLFDNHGKPLRQRGVF
jgi:hypothetical protein